MPKAGSKSKRDLDSDTSDSGPDDSPARKSQKTKPGKSGGASATDSTCKIVDGDPTWELSTNKLLKIRKFKGKTYVDIREYYTDSAGKQKPGKKGVCLSLEQWDMMTQIIDNVNDRL